MATGTVAFWGAGPLWRTLAAPPSASQAMTVPQPITHARLPRWRGFNLLEKYRSDLPQWSRAYEEWDFDVIANWGFDFVRLPTDYRIWTVSSGAYREQPLRDCVNPPKEPLDLWADGENGEEARRQFAAQWRMFAARYRGIPGSELSFNLINEPPGISGAKYLRIATAAVAAIRAEDPERLIIADGASYGGRPVPELIPLRVAQSTRGYYPAALTHYRASWVSGAEAWPVPRWPIPTQATLRIRANGVVVFEKQFLAGPGQGEWKLLQTLGRD